MNIQESLHRILERKQNVADLFYVVFLERYPEVREHFRDVDLMHQAVVLSMALMVMEQHYTRSYPVTTTYLQYIGTKHHDRGIPENLFPLFREALLHTLEQFHGPEWDDKLGAQWAGAIDKTTATMLEGYRQHFHV